MRTASEFSRSLDLWLPRIALACLLVGGSLIAFAVWRAT